MTDPVITLKQKQIQQLAQDVIDYVPPTPPTPPLDVQSWWVPKSGTFVRPCFVRLLPDGRIADYFVKQPQGWPNDTRVADANGIYDRYTDYPLQASPSAYRLYTDVNPGSKCLGMKISNRYYDPAQGRIQVAGAAQLGVEKHTNCTAFTLGGLGPWQTWMSYQKAFNLGGDLGIQDVIVCEFFYTGNPVAGFKAKEWFVLTQDSGWAAWYLYALQTDGTWAITKSSVHNLFIPDTLQVPIVPCDIVL